MQTDKGIYMLFNNGSGISLNKSQTKTKFSVADLNNPNFDKDELYEIIGSYGKCLFQSDEDDGGDCETCAQVKLSDGTELIVYHNNIDINRVKILNSGTQLEGVARVLSSNYDCDDYYSDVVFFIGKVSVIDCTWFTQDMPELDDSDDFCEL